MVVNADERRLGYRLKLRDLQMLLAIAQNGSMGKAAAALAVSQPAVSKAISDLEHALGVRLLDRNPRGVEPTVYARAVGPGRRRVRRIEAGSGGDPVPG